jgi:hypothetical protein
VLISVERYGSAQQVIERRENEVKEADGQYDSESEQTSAV